MKIQKALFSPGKGGFFFDDQRAIKNGAGQDGFIYEGAPVTPEFTNIRQAAECVSIIILLENGQYACGDATAVQYSGAGGRDPLFLTEKYIPFLNQHIKPLLETKELTSFRDMSAEFDSLIIDGQQIHTALRYGLSQALLEAVSLSRNKTRTEVICEEYHLPIITEKIPIFAQTGDDRYTGVDKMILKEVDALPHGLINNIEEKLGRNGEKLKEYIQWVIRRIEKLRKNESYLPELHFDVYGTIGIIFDYDITKIADYLLELEKTCGQYNLYIEGPVDMEEREPQIEMLKKIYDALKMRSAKVKIVADEWCNTLEDIRDFTDVQCCDMVQIKTPDLGSIHNTIESVIYCNEKGMESYQGGTCSETDLSSRNCVHAALAARPKRILAKPGMGFDEGLLIVKNEMNRTLEILRNK